MKNRNKWIGCFLGLSLIQSLSAQPLIGDLIKIQPTIFKAEVLIEGKGIISFWGDRTMSIQKLHNQQITLLPIRSANEILSFIPGVDLRQRGIQGVQADLSIRGGTNEQNLVLINGFKLIDPQTGHHALNIPILLTNLDAIEVYKGSGTRIFGQNAMTGAVNFISRPKDVLSVHAQLYGGSFDNLGGQFSVHLPYKKFRQSFSVGHDQSKGHWHNSDYTNRNYMYDGALSSKNGKHQLKGMLAYSDKSFGANGYYTNYFPEQWESTQMAFSGLSYKYLNTKWITLSKLSFRTHRDEFRLKRYDPSFYTNRHFSEVLTFEQTAQWTNILGQSSFGGEVRSEVLNSSNLGERNRQFESAFADHKVRILNGKLILCANVHFFHASLSHEDLYKLLPGFETRFKLHHKLSLFANIGQSYRTPTYTELYYQDPSNVGNPDLKPEYATNSEIGFEFIDTKYMRAKSAQISLETVLFRRNTHDMIDWIRNNSDLPPVPNPWTPVNLSNVIFQGIESRLFLYFTGTAKYIFLREISVGYNFQYANHLFVDPLLETESKYAFSGLRNQLTSKVKLDFAKYASLIVAFRGIERINTPSYTLLDVKLLSNSWKGISCFVEGNNLFNTEYVEAGYVEMPGRWMKAGLQYQFDKR